MILGSRAVVVSCSIILSRFEGCGVTDDWGGCGSLIFLYLSEPIASSSNFAGSSIATASNFLAIAIVQAVEEAVIVIITCRGPQL